jgi:tRNA A37 threonylcarbamoyladenosine modification protein TsaB
MNLYIDTTDFNKITFGLSGEGEMRRKIFKIDSHKSHETLQKLEEFLKELGVQPHLPASSPRQEKRGPIKKIYVNKGPGSYTGTRVGVTIGQALSLAWGVPAKFLSKEQYARAFNKNKN